MSERIDVQPDLLSVFNTVPGNHLLLLPNAPHYTIVGVSDDYARTVRRSREELVGRNLFDAFPDNPDDVQATGVRNLRASLRYVLEQKCPHQLDTQRYDTFDAETGKFVFQVWTAMNKPVLDAAGEVRYIIHRAEDITETVLLKKSETDAKAENKDLHGCINATQSAMSFFKPVKNASGEVVDFRFGITNKAFSSYTGHAPEDLVDDVVSKWYPAYKENGLFQLFKQTYVTGETKRLETGYRGEGLDLWLDVLCTKMNDGVIITIIDITPQKNTILEIERQKKLLDNILTYSSSGISVTQVIRDEQGNVIDGRTILANDAAIKFTGIPKELYLTRTALELDPDIIHTAYFQMVLDALATGNSFQTQYFIESTGRWLELSVSKMDEDHLVHIFTDITGSKRAEAEFKKAAGRLAAIFHTSQSGIFTFRPERNEAGEIIDFRFVIANPTFAAYVGQTPEALEGALGSTYFPGYLHNGVFDMYKHTYLTGETQRKNIHYFVDGLDLYLDLLSTRLHDEVLVTFSDYTPLQKTQLQLEKSIEDLKRSNANLEEFAYAASHDLKEPIRKVHVFSDRLKNLLSERMDSHEKGLFERMENAARRMSTLIDDLLAYSHLSTRNDSLEEIDLNQKLVKVIDDLEVIVEEKKATIRVEPLPVIKGLRRQVQQLFQNLVGNALKYNMPGIPPDILIRSRLVLGRDVPVNVALQDLNREFHLIEVKDNGIGFEQKDADRIFQVFQRLHGNHEYKGTGIGLSIARKVAANHEGYIWAESEPGKGATFFVLLPVSTNQE